MNKTLKYLRIRIDQLREELAKNSSNGNDLILSKAISELETVEDLVRRELLLSGSPYNTDS